MAQNFVGSNNARGPGENPLKRESTAERQKTGKTSKKAKLQSCLLLVWFCPPTKSSGTTWGISSGDRADTRL